LLFTAPVPGDLTASTVIQTFLDTAFKGASDPANPATDFYAPQRDAQVTFSGASILQFSLAALAVLIVVVAL
jgi:hypothetical protein